MFSRRNVLSFMGGITTVSLVGCWRNQSSSADPTIAQQTIAAPVKQPACVVKPEQTEGPYFVDEKLNRSDIRANTTDGSIKPGIPLQLAFQISQVSANACAPLGNAIVDVWHCDASGAYSDVADRNFNTVGQNFLRGSQVTDTDGKVQFVTIYPGWYPGRTVHVHFKIRSNNNPQQAYEFTSQLYFDDSLTDRVQSQAPYNAKGERSTRNDQDGIFRNGGEQLLLQLTPVAEGYTALFAIGLELA